MIPSNFETQIWKELNNNDEFLAPDLILYFVIPLTLLVRERQISANCSYQLNEYIRKVLTPIYTEEQSEFLIFRSLILLLLNSEKIEDNTEKIKVFK